MRPFRAILSGLCAAAIALPASAACLQPAERAAFDVQALKSHLMVTAIACRHEDQYNAFVTRFQRDLSAAGRAVQAHFRRAYGRAHQRELDSYITNLANAQSQEGIRQGSFFCRDQTPAFQQVMAMQGASALAQLSQERRVINVYGTEACATPPVREARAASPLLRQARASTLASAR
ncbi:hypothetical protein M0638_01950 [Roseomonas sp. NAR14]|uniref:Uncharacterized protein n=1 Tax=Roseomonas acroporae TaxID=2937791 RepID=A0A9X1Y4S9_9PROT|nr:hypothetical protein [Roseomonas acroporae]MCK8783142.1 hypothetical protein [Roseomonas acroporae]